MGESFGNWLILLVALLAGLAVGWVLLRGRREEPPAPAAGTTSDATTGASEPAPVTADAEPTATAEPTVTEPTPAAPTSDETAAPAGPASAAEPTSTAVTEPTATTTADSGTAGTADETRATEDAQPVSVLDGPAADATAQARPVVATPPVRPQAAPVPAVDAAAGPAPTVPAAAAATADEPATAQPATADAATDDFRRIQGVGPKMAAALHGAGIRTYRQLAELDEAALRETIRNAGLRATASLVTWPQQAKVLAAQADGDS